MKRLKIGDVLLLIGIPLLAVGIWVLLFLGSRPADVAVITVNGEEVCRLPLDTDTTREINGGTHLVVVESGEVWVERADCPDGICMNHLPISKSGQTVVCLPYRLVITVEEGSP